MPGIVRSEILKPLTWRTGRTAPDSLGSSHLCELWDAGYQRVRRSGPQVLHSLPSGCGRAGLALAITDNDDSDEIRVVEDTSVRDSKCVTKLSTLVNAAGSPTRGRADVSKSLQVWCQPENSPGMYSLGVDVTRHATRPAEGANELLDAVFGLRPLRAEVTHRSLDVQLGKDGRSSVRLL